MRKLRLAFVFIFVCNLVLFVFTAQGQETEPVQEQESDKTTFADRFFFGGNLGLQFGNTTYIDVSPLVGYKITKKLHAGLGVTYIYLNSKVIFSNSQVYRYETSMYGGRLFGRYFVLDNLFGHVEYEYLNLGYPFYRTSTNKIEIQRENVHSFFVGGGYAQELGRNSAVVLMLLWNLNEGAYTPYQNPIIRIGINAGF